MDAGVALPERRELRLSVGARRSGSATERLDGIEVLRVRRARESSRRGGPELRVALDDERRGERQSLRAHRRGGRDRSPLTDRRSSGERRVAHAEAVCRAPGEYGLRDVCAPRDAALPRLSAVSAVVAERRERSRVPVTQLCRPGREQADQRRVRGSNDRCPARRSGRNEALSVAVDVLDEDRRVAALDPVVGIEDGCVNDGAEALARRVRRVRRDERLDEDLIPVQYLVRVLFRRLRDPRAGARTSERNRCGRCGENRDPGRGEDESPMEIHCLLPSVRWCHRGKAGVARPDFESWKSLQFALAPLTFRARAGARAPCGSGRRASDRRASARPRRCAR